MISPMFYCLFICLFHQLESHYVPVCSYLEAFVGNSHHLFFFYSSFNNFQYGVLSLHGFCEVYCLFCTHSEVCPLCSWNILLTRLYYYLPGNLLWLLCSFSLADQKCLKVENMELVFPAVTSISLKHIRKSVSTVWVTLLRIPVIDCTIPP